MPDKDLTPPTASVYKLNPELSYFSTKARVEFDGTCLKQNKGTFNHGKVVNIYIAHEINDDFPVSSYLTLGNCLFGAVSLTKNADIDRYKYSQYGIGFDRHGSFPFPGIGLGRNVIIFGVDTSSSVHVDKKKKYILILTKVPTKGLEHILSAEKMYLINFIKHHKKLFELAL